MYQDNSQASFGMKALTDGKKPGTFFNIARTWSLVGRPIGSPRLTPGEAEEGGGFDVDAEEGLSCCDTGGRSRAGS